MRFLLITVFFACQLQCFAQKQLTLIIDTIDFVDDFNISDFKVTLTNQGFGNLGETDSAGKVTTTLYPNFQTTVTLQTDSTRIHIPIDQHNGYLELSNIYISDTLRINRLVIYSNCYIDTTRTRKEYYRVENDSISEKPYKVKIKEKTKKNKCKRKPPANTIMRINSKNYLVRIEKQKSEFTEYSQGHGYKPQRFEGNDDNYSGTFLHYRSITERYINVIEVEIQ